MESIWTNVTDTVIQPARVFERLRQRPQVAIAFVLIVLGQLAFGLGGANMTADFDLGPLGTVIGTIFVGIPLLLLTTFFTQLSARIFGARGSYWALVSAFGYTSIPLILQAPVVLVATAVGAPWLTVLGQVGLGIWSLVLDVIAIREIYSVGTGRSIGIFVVGVLFFIILFTLIAFVFGVLAAIFMGGILP